MEDSTYNKLLKEYLDNSISDADEVKLFDQLSAGLPYDTLDQTLNDEWEKTSSSGQLTSKQSDEIFNRIVLAKEHKKLLWQQWISWAAVFFVILFGAWYFMLFISPRTVQPEVFKTVVALEEHKKLTLPDGSTVILNRNSKLSYSQNPDAKKREVTLSGEGYFDVRHDHSRPFIVNAGKLSTTVLGTAFNIKTSANDSKVIITVVRGKVRVNKKDNVIGVLTPNQQIAYNSRSDVIDRAVVQAIASVKWQAADLYFNDQSMVDVMNQLANHFKIKIIFSNDTGKSCRITATFTAGESLEDILKIISAYNGAQYKITPGEVTISAKDCQTNH